MLKKSVIFAGALAATALVLTGCMTVITDGPVLSKDFAPSHTVHVTVCDSYGYVPEMTFTLGPDGTLQQGVTTVYKCLVWGAEERIIPDAWSLTIGDEAAETAVYAVSEEIFQEARTGYLYDSETGKLEAR